MMNDNLNNIKDKNNELNLTIRHMIIDDIAPVFHLGEKLFTLNTFPTLYRTWDEYEVINNFQNDQDYCLVAEEGGVIVGFLLGTVIAKRKSSWRYGYLIWLGVALSHQSKGVASSLFHHFRDLMLKNGVRMLLVDTQADNTTALRFFEKMGFEKPQKHIFLSLNMSEALDLYNAGERNKDDKKK